MYVCSVLIGSASIMQQVKAKETAPVAADKASADKKAATGKAKEAEKDGKSKKKASLKGNKR